MNVSILYHQNSDHERNVIDFEREYTRRTGHNLELISLETVDGAQKAKLYDIVQYPAIVITDNAGVLHKAWQGGSLPTFDDVQAYSIV